MLKTFGLFDWILFFFKFESNSRDGLRFKHICGAKKLTLKGIFVEREKMNIGNDENTSMLLKLAFKSSNKNKCIPCIYLQ